MARPRKPIQGEDGLMYAHDSHIPTNRSRGRVIEFVCSGFKQEQIASYFDISVETLHQHYKKELTSSNMTRTSKLGRNLYLDALAGDRWSREFWLKTQGKWSCAKPEELKKVEDSIAFLTQFALTQKINSSNDNSDKGST